MSPIRRSDSAFSSGHINRSSCVARLRRRRHSSHDPSQLVGAEGALRPPPRVPGLASHDRLARPSLGRPRWHADRRRHLEALCAAWVSAQPSRRVPASAAPRRVPHLACQWSTVWRQPVVPLGSGLRRELTAGGSRSDEGELELGVILESGDAHADETQRPRAVAERAVEQRAGQLADPRTVVGTGP